MKTPLAVLSLTRMFLPHFAVASLLVAVSSLQAQTTYTWTSTSGNAAWNNAANWAGAMIPVSGSLNTIQYYASTSGAANTATTFTSTQNLGNGFQLQTLDLRGTAAVANQTITINTNSLAFTGAANSIINSGGSGNLNYTISSAVSFTNGLTLAGNGLGNVQLGQLSGSGGLTKNGTGRFTLSGSSSYTGGTVLNAGRLILATDTGLSSSGTLSLNGGTLTYSGLASGNTRTVTNNVEVGGDFQLVDSVNIQGGSTLLLSGAINLGGATRVVIADVGGSTGAISQTSPAVLSGIVSNGGITKSGRGVLSLSNGANSYTGDTTVRYGTLRVDANALEGVNGALGNATSAVQLSDAGSTANNTVAMVIGGTFTVGRQISVNNFNSTGTTAIGGINATGTSTYTNTISLGKNVVLVAGGTAGGGTVNFSGEIEDGAGSAGVSIGSLGIWGGGTVNLSRAAGNSYDGGTTVNVGTLLVNNTSNSATGTGAVNVNAGTLGGNGLVSGAVTIGNGAGGSDSFLSAGNSIGTFTIGSSLNLQSDATFVFELNSAAAAADQVIANGVTINGSSVFSFTDLGAGVLAPNLEFVVINNTSGSAIIGTFGNLADGSTFTSGANEFLVSYSGGTGNDLSLTVVPEPSTVILSGLGILVFLGMVRRGRRVAH